MYSSKNQWCNNSLLWQCFLKLVDWNRNVLFQYKWYTVPMVCFLIKSQRIWIDFTLTKDVTIPCYDNVSWKLEDWNEGTLPKKKSTVKRCTQIVTDPSKYVLVLRYHQDFVLIFLRQIASLVKFSTKSILIPCKLCEHNCYFNVVWNNSLLRFNNIIRATTANVLLFRK